MTDLINIANAMGFEKYKNELTQIRLEYCIGGGLKIRRIELKKRF